MRTVLTGIAGAVLLVAGIAMLVLPGPGWLAIVAGLALLARRFDWAHGLLSRARERLPRRLSESRPVALALPDGVEPHEDEDPAVPAA